jgi:hypothetical protein
MPVRVRGVARSIDDQVLAAIQMHQRGAGWAAIGLAIGWSGERAFMAVRRVIKSDVAEAPYWGDDQKEVKRFWK